jgi:uncharacterized protein YbjT (DUF2867 family)
VEKKILVIGGTGLLGQPVARRLQEDGFQVRVMVRDPAKAKGPFSESFEILAGDITDRASVEKALDGCTGVHISVGGDAEHVGTQNVVAAAVGKGLERLTYMSGQPCLNRTAGFRW